MRTIKLYAATALWIGAMVLGQSPPTAAQVAVSPSQIGLGLESAGSTCCISIRVWTTDLRGLELVVNAEQLLFLTVRGLSRFTDNPTVNGYTGAGLTLVLGIPQPVAVSPIETLQFLVGAEAPLSFPFYPQ